MSRTRSMFMAASSWLVGVLVFALTFLAAGELLTLLRVVAA